MWFEKTTDGIFYLNSFGGLLTEWNTICFSLCTLLTGAVQRIHQFYYNLIAPPLQLDLFER